jgi:hypothetical protein
MPWPLNVRLDANHMSGKYRSCDTRSITPPLSGDTGPPPRRVFVFIGCVSPFVCESREYNPASRLRTSIRVNDSLAVAAPRASGARVFKPSSTMSRR